jgi:hypothetical protein
MQVTPENVVWAIGVGSGIAVSLFHLAFYLGKLTNDVKRAHDRLDGHDDQLGELQHRRVTDRPFPR